MKVIKGDTVEILTGKDAGKQGRVVRVIPDAKRVLVENVNMVKRHEKVRAAQGRGGVTGGIINKEMPVDVSNVAVVCSTCDKPTRVGYTVGLEGKERVCKKCGGKL
jgi:large subunit ribosomal protein L24